MGVSLVKGQKISLEKESGTRLNAVFMGLGWDAVRKKGFLGFGGGSGEIDLDASCVMFDEAKNPVDVVYFGHLQSNDGSIRHSGDNLTGEGEGDDEVINVALDRVPANVHSLVFTVNSFRGQTFDEVENAFCRLVNTADGREIARYQLSGGGAHTAMIMARLYRHNGEWKMAAIGEPASGQTVDALVPNIQRLI